MFEIDNISVDSEGNLVMTALLCYDDSNINENQDIIEGYINSLPDITTFTKIKEETDCCYDSFYNYNRKGLITYDNYDGKNELIAIPDKKLNIKDISPKIAALL